MKCSNNIIIIIIILIKFLEQLHINYLKIQEFLKLYGTMSIREIAEKLDISERTVKNHISNIFKKIEVTDRTQAAVFAIRNNLITI